MYGTALVVYDLDRPCRGLVEYALALLHAALSPAAGRDLGQSPLLYVFLEHEAVAGELCRASLV